MAATKIFKGKIFRPVNQEDRVAGGSFVVEKAIWQVVVLYAARLKNWNAFLGLHVLPNSSTESAEPSD
jgi:hypothetical protein